MFCPDPEIVFDADGVTYVGSTPHRRDRPNTHIAKVAQGAPFASATCALICADMARLAALIC
jgi:hypothetical protein